MLTPSFHSFYRSDDELFIIETDNESAAAISGAQSNSFNEYDFETSIEILAADSQSENVVVGSESDPLETYNADSANSAANHIVEANKVVVSDVNANISDVLELNDSEIQPAVAHSVDETTETKIERSQDSFEMKDVNSSLNVAAESYSDDSDVVEVLAYMLEDGVSNDQ